jgi:hypothetical protein
MTTLELLTNFWEDQFHQDKSSLRKTKSGEIIFRDTGDDLIDKWEKEFSMGLEPDLFEGLSQEQKNKLKTLNKSQPQIAQDDIEFSENF